MIMLLILWKLAGGDTMLIEGPAARYRSLKSLMPCRYDMTSTGGLVERSRSMKLLMRQEILQRIIDALEPCRLCHRNSVRQ